MNFTASDISETFPIPIPDEDAILANEALFLQTRLYFCKRGFISANFVPANEALYLFFTVAGGENCRHHSVKYVK